VWLPRLASSLPCPFPSRLRPRPNCSLGNKPAFVHPAPELDPPMRALELPPAFPLALCPTKPRGAHTLHLAHHHLSTLNKRCRGAAIQQRKWCSHPASSSSLADSPARDLAQLVHTRAFCPFPCAHPPHRRRILATPGSCYLTSHLTPPRNQCCLAPHFDCLRLCDISNRLNNDSHSNLRIFSPYTRQRSPRLPRGIST
jgi:hypothetical protein